MTYRDEDPHPTYQQPPNGLKYGGWPDKRDVHHDDEYYDDEYYEDEYYDDENGDDERKIDRGYSFIRRIPRKASLASKVLLGLPVAFFLAYALVQSRFAILIPVGMFYLVFSLVGKLLRTRLHKKRELEAERRAKRRRRERITGYKDPHSSVAVRIHESENPPPEVFVSGFYIRCAGIALAAAMGAAAGKRACSPTIIVISIVGGVIAFIAYVAYTIFSVLRPDKEE